MMSHAERCRVIITGEHHKTGAHLRWDQFARNDARKHSQTSQLALLPIAGSRFPDPSLSKMRQSSSHVGARHRTLVATFLHALLVPLEEKQPPKPSEPFAHFDCVISRPQNRRRK